MVTLCVHGSRVPHCHYMLVDVGSDVELCKGGNMTKIKPSINVSFLRVATILCVIPQCLAALSDKQLCHDPKCSEPISLARTILAYRSNDREVMSFGTNAEVVVYSRGAGKRTDLWGVKINGKRGFAPKTFLSEYKVLKHDLSYEVPVYKYNDKTNKVQPEKLELLENENSESQALLKDELSRDDNETPGKSTDKSAIEESHAINADSVLRSYEVIDGTTVYLENPPSVQPSFVYNVAHATALPNEKALVASDSEIDKKLSSDKNTFTDSKESQPGMSDLSSKLEGIQSIDTQKQTGSGVPQENPEAISNSTLATEDLALNSQSEKELLKKNVEHAKESDSSVEENVKDNEKEKITEPVENDGIFASITKTFNILSSSEETVTVTTDSTTAQRDDTAAPESTVDSNLRSEEQVSENIGVKDTVTEKILPSTETKLESSIDQSVIDKEKIETQQKIVDESKNGIFASITKPFKILSSSEETVTVTTDSTTTQSDDTAAPKSTVDSNLRSEERVSKNIGVKDTVTEKILPSTETKLESSIDQSVIDKEKIETQQKIVDESKNDSAIILDEKIKEVPTIILENTTSPRDVPLSNNFVRENTDTPAKELPTAPSISAEDSPASAKPDVDSHAENIQVQETSKTENVTEDVRTDGAIISDEKDSTKTQQSNLQETVTTEIPATESSNDIETKLPESGERYLENTKKETNDQADKTVIVDNLKTTESLETTENIATESPFESNSVENITIAEETLIHSTADIQSNEESIVHSNVNKNENLVNDTSSDNVPIESNEFLNSVLGPKQSIDSSQENMILEQKMTLNKEKRDLLSIENGLEHQDNKSQVVKEEETLPEYGDHISSEAKILNENRDGDNSLEKPESISVPGEVKDETCMHGDECERLNEFLNQKEDFESTEYNLMDMTKLNHNYWKTLICLCITAFTILVFTLGYYYIENTRRDGQLIERINKLERDLLISTEECKVLSENLKSTKDKLLCIEDESFGSNEMVVSLKADLEMSQNAKIELEEQVSMLEKDLENATEAGLELERMLREVLSSNNEVNPLAQSVEDLQARLNAQQAANESLTNALNLKAQELETLSANLAAAKKQCNEFEIEYLQTQEELTAQNNLKNNIEQTLKDKIHSLEEQVEELATEKSSLYKELRGKELEVKEQLEIISQVKSNNLDLEKLYDVSHIKIEAVQLREERDELKMRLNDVEGAHQLLEEHMKLVKEEIIALTEQCKMAEKEKKDAETRLEVLSKFFQEKETERQKEETVWLQKQGEVVSTVERLHTMQNEIQNYKQQIEMLKREIMDQEREYRNQISALETKAHEQWVAARQNERRLEESKAEAGQLRNRLTLVEKNLNDTDPEAKLHRLEANGETATSPSLFIGAESSNSPVMFSGSSGVPPPPPSSYLPFPPPYLPPLPPAAASGLPPYDISQRPPPLGGRLSSPPPMLPPPPALLHRPPVSGGRYENAGSPPPPPPPPMSPPHLLPHFDHRSPPLPPYGGDHIPPLPPPGSILPPPLGATHPWGEESLPYPRNSGFHPHQREQRTRNHKGSLHSSGESLDKAHHGKV